MYHPPAMPFHFFQTTNDTTICGSSLPVDLASFFSFSSSLHCSYTFLLAVFWIARHELALGPLHLFFCFNYFSLDICMDNSITSYMPLRKSHIHKKEHLCSLLTCSLPYTLNSSYPDLFDLFTFIKVKFLVLNIFF